MTDWQQFWLKAQAIPQDNGIMISVPDEPLSFIWQTREQAEEIVRRIQAALEQLPGFRRPDDIAEIFGVPATAEQVAAWRKAREAAAPGAIVPFDPKTGMPL